MNGIYSRKKFKRIRTSKSLRSAYSPRGALVYKVGVPIKTVLPWFFRFLFFHPKQQRYILLKTLPLRDL